MRQSKTLILSTNVDQKSLETGFSIAICRPIFRLPCVARFFDCHVSPDWRQMAIKISVKIECLISFLCNRLQYDFKLSLVQ